MMNYQIIAVFTYICQMSDRRQPTSEETVQMVKLSYVETLAWIWTEKPTMLKLTSNVYSTMRENKHSN
jgi:hypothetical protein